jgi:50S ribosomal subunit-associated GTPase HflX
MKRSDLAVLVTEAGVWTEHEENLLAELRALKIPVLVALNKADILHPHLQHLTYLEQKKVPYVLLAAATGQGIELFRFRLQGLVSSEITESPVVLRDLVGPQETAILVMPIDKEAPKGRIKQLQVQSIRDLLDGESC